MQDVNALIGKKLSGQITPEEDRQLQAWLDSDPDHRVVMAEAERIWRGALHLRQGEPAGAENAWEEFKGLKQTRVAKVWYRPLPMAATLAILIGAALLVRYLMVTEAVNPSPLSVIRDTIKPPVNRDTEGTAIVMPADTSEETGPVQDFRPVKPRAEKTVMVAVTSGDTALVFLLPDSSKVYLNKHSKLTYPEHFTARERRVHLSGEAFFEVVKNKGEFIVWCQDTKTRVLGTSFNIHGYEPNRKVEVTVVTGLVEVTNMATKKPGIQLQLKPGEQGTFLAKTNEASRSKASKHKWWKKSDFRSRIREFFNKITHKNK